MDNFTLISSKEENVTNGQKIKLENAKKIV